MLCLKRSYSPVVQELADKYFIHAHKIFTALQLGIRPEELNSAFLRLSRARKNSLDECFIDECLMIISSDLKKLSMAEKSKYAIDVMGKCGHALIPFLMIYNEL